MSGGDVKDGAGGVCGKHGLYDGLRCPDCSVSGGDVTARGCAPDCESNVGFYAPGIPAPCTCGASRGDVTARESLVQSLRADAEDIRAHHPGITYVALVYEQAAETISVLLAELEAADERLAAYEEPGWWNAVQKVQQLKKQFQAAEARTARLTEALRAARVLFAQIESHAGHDDTAACVEDMLATARAGLTRLAALSLSDGAGDTETAT